MNGVRTVCYIRGTRKRALLSNKVVPPTSFMEPKPSRQDSMTTMNKSKKKCSFKSHFLFLSGCVSTTIPKTRANTQQAERILAKYHMIMF